jgi:hypothetical protein
VVVGAERELCDEVAKLKLHREWRGIAMNWRRGAFRVWVVVSTAWILLVGANAYDKIVTPMREARASAACAKEREANPELGKPLDCFEEGQDIFADLVPFAPRAVVPHLVAALSVPALLMIVWFVCGWVGAGFRKAGSQE